MRASLLLLLVCSSGCIHSYAAREPLRYQEIVYDSPSGKEWPEKYVEVPEAAKRWNLPGKTSVCYVELNPSGETTLVFLHGLGSYLKFWRYQLDGFAKQGFHVVALDMLGYGKSDKPAQFPYTTEAMADVVREVLQAIGSGDPILVGHSMGGQIAMSFAIRYPEDLSGLVLTAPAGFETFSRKEKAWFESAVSSVLFKAASEENIWGSIRRANFYNWRPELEWLIEERVRLAKTPEFDSYAYANVKSVHGLAWNDFVRTNLGSISVPTLIIHGDKDRLIPNPFLHPGTARAIMEEGAKRIKGSQLVTLEDCGHTVQMDCDKQYNKEVTRFLQSEITGKPARVAQE